MKNISLKLLFVFALVVVAAWTQFHTADLPMLGALGLVPAFGYLIATPKKRAQRQVRMYVENFTE
jgi:hypothetical protein